MKIRDLMKGDCTDTLTMGLPFAQVMPTVKFGCGISVKYFCPFTGARCASVLMKTLLQLDQPIDRCNIWSRRACSVFWKEALHHIFSCAWRLGKPLARADRNRNVSLWL